LSQAFIRKQSQDCSRNLRWTIGVNQQAVAAILDQELGRDPSSASAVRPATFRPLRVVRDPRAA
jgi:hypothetical protein